MEIYQIVLMVIGAITLVWLLYKAVKGILWLLGAGLESCFREKYPYDFQMNLGWIIKEMNARGYEQTSTIDAGGDYPGVIMRHPETDIEIEVRLRAPLLTAKDYMLSSCKILHLTKTKDFWKNIWNSQLFQTIRQGFYENLA